MTIATILAFVIRYRKLLLIAAAALAVVLALWWTYSTVWHRGYAEANAEWEARQRAAEAKAAADTAALHQALADIDTNVTLDMEAVQNVRTIYRDKVRTVAVEIYRDRQCDVPGSVLGDINAAAAGYAAAASGAGQPAVRPAPAAR